MSRFARGRIPAYLLLLAVAGTHRTHAQNADLSRRAVSQRASQDPLPPKLVGTDTAVAVIPRLSRLPLWSAPLASAIVPGLGQARLGQDRFVVYLAMESFLVLQYVKNHGEGGDNAANYRAIARDVARRGFPGTRPDTVWQYYEKLEKYNASGVFSKSLGPTVPETDPATFNGQQWALARNVFGIPLDDPDPSGRNTYAQAVAYYETRAITTPYGWNWVNASLEKDLYIRTIGQANDAYKRATNDLIVVIANHLVSMVDAFSSVRIMQADNGTLRAGARFSVP